MTFQGIKRFDLSPDRTCYLEFDGTYVHLYANGTLVTSWGSDAVGFFGTTPVSQQSAGAAVTTTAPVSGIGYGLSYAAMYAFLQSYNATRASLIAAGYLSA